MVSFTPFFVHKELFYFLLCVWVCLIQLVFFFFFYSGSLCLYRPLTLPCFTSLLCLLFANLSHMWHTHPISPGITSSLSFDGTIPKIYMTSICTLVKKYKEKFTKFIHKQFYLIFYFRESLFFQSYSQKRKYFLD